jgi:hypothetical protein
MNGIDQSRQNRLLGLGSPHHEGEISVGRLGEWVIHSRPNLGIERPIFDVVDYAHNFRNGFGRKLSVANFLADGIFAGEVLPSECLINDQNPGLGGIVELSEVTPAQKCGFQSRKQGRVDIALVHFIVFAVVGMAYDANPSRVAVVADRQNRGHAD